LLAKISAFFKFLELIGASAVHWIGDIRPGEDSLLVSVLSEHREQRFKCCILIVDSIKN